MAEDLAKGFYLGVQPPNDDLSFRHGQTMLSLTLHRATFARGECEKGDEVSEGLQKLYVAFSDLFNGDRRKSFAEHFCFKGALCICGGTVESCVKYATSLVVAAFF
jgi:hypothetical protein